MQIDTTKVPIIVIIDLPPKNCNFWNDVGINKSNNIVATYGIFLVKLDVTINEDENEISK